MRLSEVIFLLVNTENTENWIDYLFKVTKSVIEDFEQDNVKYLELRSTPRTNPDTGTGIHLVELQFFFSFARKVRVI